MSSPGTESDEDSPSYYWNNWKPSTSYEKPIRGSLPIPKQSQRYGNWIPPTNFGQRKQITQETVIEFETIQEPQQSRINFKCSPLNDLFESESGEYWIFINPGSFGNFKVGFNQYGNYTVYADAEILNKYGSDKIFITINTDDHLRKLLEIPCSQWQALKESMEIKQKCLQYAALKPNSNLSKLSNLEKLWHLICHRRHGLSTKAVLVYRHGVQKIQYLLQLVPKFIVKDIRMINYEEIV